MFRQIKVADNGSFKYVQINVQMCKSKLPIMVHLSMCKSKLPIMVHLSMCKSMCKYANVQIKVADNGSFKYMQINVQMCKPKLSKMNGSFKYVQKLS